MTQAPNSSGPGAIISAVDWLEGALLGTSATTIAIIAVATVGFLMLSGRIDVRRGARVVLGCFIIFGASTIAGGILGAVSGMGADPSLAQSRPPSPSPPLPPPATYQPTSSSPFDPYAGAAAPKQ
jgi:type IV secretory pathway VirB2 component (pilin)